MAIARAPPDIVEAQIHEDDDGNGPRSVQAMASSDEQRHSVTTTSCEPSEPTPRLVRSFKILFCFSSLDSIRRRVYTSVMSLLHYTQAVSLLSQGVVLVSEADKMCMCVSIWMLVFSLPALVGACCWPALLAALCGGSSRPSHLSVHALTKPFPSATDTLKNEMKFLIPRSKT